MTKLESYQLEGSFNATMFYADIEGHPDDRLVRLAFEELEFFSHEVRILGTYAAGTFRTRKIKVVIMRPLPLRTANGCFDKMRKRVVL